MMDARERARRFLSIFRSFTAGPLPTMALIDLLENEVENMERTERGKSTRDIQRAAEVAVLEEALGIYDPVCEQTGLATVGCEDDMTAAEGIPRGEWCIVCRIRAMIEERKG